jgi:hypothetical protein
MKKIIYIIAITLSSSVFSNTINIDGSKFNVEKLGKFHIVTKVNPSLSVQRSIDGEHSRAYKVDCDEISDVVGRLERRIKRCSDDSESTSCKYTKDRIYEYARENLNLHEMPDQYFKIQYSFLEESNLVDKVSKKLGIHKGLIKVQTELSSNFEIESLKVTTSRESLMEKVSTLNLFDKSGVSEHYYNQYLKVDNRLLYCDVLSKKAQISIDIKNEIQNTEKVSASLKILGNKLYQKLLKHRIESTNTKLIQAANLGFLIGAELEGNKHEMNIKSVFKSMITDKHRNLEVIKYSNQSNFEETIYPDKIFSKKIKQQFNVIIK